MEKPKHLEYLSKPLDWYVRDHAARQSGIGDSHSNVPSYNLEQLLKRNNGREYKGVHPYCGADELGEIITCVIFKTDKDGKRDYYHNLYLGPETRYLQRVHSLILEKLGITSEQYQKSQISKF